MQRRITSVAIAAFIGLAGTAHATVITGVDIFNGTTPDATFVGSAALVAGLPIVDNGNYADARGWAADATAGLVPLGTNSVVLELQGTKSDQGTAIDSYLDLVDFQVHRTAVPEPGTLTLAALGGIGIAAWRFRKRGRTA